MKNSFTGIDLKLEKPDFRNFRRKGGEDRFHGLGDGLDDASWFSSTCDSMYRLSPTKFEI